MTNVDHRLLRGHTALVTGSSRGIGAATIEQLAQAGASAVINYCEREDAAESVVARIRNNGGDAIAVRADVSDPEQVAQLFSAARRQYGTVDILVNNAYCFPAKLKPFIETRWDEFTEQYLGVVGSAYFCAREALSDMLSTGWGRIVNVASTTIWSPEPGFHARATAKDALHGFTTHLAKEVVTRGVLVSCVVPWWTDTDQIRPFTSHCKDAVQRSPLGRLLTPSEVAGVIVGAVINGDAGSVIAATGGAIMR